MPWIKKLGTKQTSHKRKQGETKRWTKSLPRPLPRLESSEKSAIMHNYVRMTAASSTMITSASAETNFSFRFLLSNISGITDLASLYDAFKINWVEAMVYPDVQQTTCEATVNIGATYGFCAIDYDNDATQTIAQIEQYENCEVFSQLRPYTRRFVPRFLGAAISNSSVNQAAISQKGWIDFAADDTPHFGLLFDFPTASVHVNVLRVIFRFGISCRSTR